MTADAPLLLAGLRADADESVRNAQHRDRFAGKLIEHRIAIGNVIYRPLLARSGVEDVNGFAAICAGEIGHRIFDDHESAGRFRA